MILNSEEIKHDQEPGEIFDMQLQTDEQIVGCARKLQEMGGRNILVSMAGNGALLLDETGCVHRISCPEGLVVNSVGAGDSMVAGFLAGYLQTGDYGYALKLGVAAGSATAFSMAAVRSSARSRLLAALYSQFTEGERIRNETLKTRISFSLLMAKQRGRGPSVSDWSHYT